MDEKTIVITLGPNGLSVTGPLDDKVVCYGMLDAAKDIVQEHHIKKAQAPANGLQVIRTPFDPTARAALTGFPPEVTITPAKE